MAADNAVNPLGNLIKQKDAAVSVLEPADKDTKLGLFSKLGGKTEDKKETGDKKEKEEEKTEPFNFSDEK
jgi:hypothetical protein